MKDIENNGLLIQEFNIADEYNLGLLFNIHISVDLKILSAKVKLTSIVDNKYIISKDVYTIVNYSEVYNVVERFVNQSREKFSQFVKLEEDLRDNEYEFLIKLNKLLRNPGE